MKEYEVFVEHFCRARTTVLACDQIEAREKIKLHTDDDYVIEESTNSVSLREIEK